jgi:hypothetical protein
MNQPVTVNVTPEVVTVPLPDGTMGLMFAAGCGPLGTHLVGTAEQIVAFLEMALDKARPLAADVKRNNSGLVAVQTIPGDLPFMPMRPGMKPHVPVMPWQR